MALGAGCREAGSRSCNDVCDHANACTVAQRPADVECRQFCPDVEALNRRMQDNGFPSCQEQFDQHLACWEDNLSQICNPDFTDCADSGQAWTACMALYCETNETDVNCKGDGTPALAPF